MANYLFPQDRLAGLLDPAADQNPFDDSEYFSTAVTVNFLKSGMANDSDIKANIRNIVMASMGYADSDDVIRIAKALDSDFWNRIGKVYVDSEIGLLSTTDSEIFQRLALDSEAIQGIVDALNNPGTYGRSYLDSDNWADFIAAHGLAAEATTRYNADSDIRASIDSDVRAINTRIRNIVLVDSDLASNYNGFVNRAGELTWDNGTRTLNVPVPGEIWVNGKQFIKNADMAVSIPNTPGIYAVYFDANGTLVSAPRNYFNLDVEAPVAYVYWNGSSAPYVAEERHDRTMDWKTHVYLHQTRGASVVAVPAGYGITGSTNTDGTAPSDAIVTIGAGQFYDEDILFTTTTTTNIPVFYRQGTVWVKDTASAYPYKLATNTAGYNLNTAGTWSVADIGSNFGVMFVCATNDINTQLVSIMGQGTYNTLGQAEEAAWGDLDLTGLPVAELVPLWKLNFRTAATYTNAVKVAQKSFTKLFLSQGSAGAAGSGSGIDVDFRDTPQQVFAADAVARQAWRQVIDSEIDRIGDRALRNNPGSVADSEGWVDFIESIIPGTNVLTGNKDPRPSDGIPGNFYIDTDLVSKSTFRLWYKDSDTRWLPTGNVVAEANLGYNLIVTGVNTAGSRSYVVSVTAPEVGFPTGSITIASDLAVPPISVYNGVSDSDSIITYVSSGFSIFVNAFQYLGSNLYKVGVATNYNPATGTFTGNAYTLWQGTGTPSAPQNTRVYQVKRDPALTNINISISPGVSQQIVGVTATTEYNIATWADPTNPANLRVFPDTTGWGLLSNPVFSPSVYAATYDGATNITQLSFRRTFFDPNGAYPLTRPSGFDSDLWSPGTLITRRPGGQAFPVVATSYIVPTNRFSGNITANIFVAGDARIVFNGAPSVASQWSMYRAAEQQRSLQVNNIQTVSADQLAAELLPTQLLAATTQNNLNNLILDQVADVVVEPTVNDTFANFTAALLAIIAFGAGNASQSMIFDPSTDRITINITGPLSRGAINYNTIFSTLSSPLLHTVAGGFAVNKLDWSFNPSGPANISIVKPQAGVSTFTLSMVGTLSSRAYVTTLTSRGVLNPLDNTYTITTLVDSDRGAGITNNFFSSVFITSLDDTAKLSYSRDLNAWIPNPDTVNDIDSVTSAAVQYTMPTNLSAPVRQASPSNYVLRQRFPLNFNSGSTGVVFSYYFPLHFAQAARGGSRDSETSQLVNEGYFSVSIPPNTTRVAARTAIINAFNASPNKPALTTMTVSAEAGQDSDLLITFINPTTITPDPQGSTGVIGVAVAIGPSTGGTGTTFDSDRYFTNISTPVVGQTQGVPQNIRFANPVSGTSVIYAALEPQMTYVATNAVSRAVNAISQSMRQWVVRDTKYALRLTSTAPGFKTQAQLVQASATPALSITQNILSYGQDPMGSAADSTFRDMPQAVFAADTVANNAWSAWAKAKIDSELPNRLKSKGGVSLDSDARGVTISTGRSWTWLYNTWDLDPSNNVPTFVGTAAATVNGTAYTGDVYRYYSLSLPAQSGTASSASYYYRFVPNNPIYNPRGDSFWRGYTAPNPPTVPNGSLSTLITTRSQQ